MKTSIYSKLGIAILALAMSVPAFGAQTALREGKGQSQGTTQADSNGVWHTVSYPFVFAGKTGYSVLRTPLILGETMIGERKVISKRGLFTRDEEMKRADRNQRHPLFRD